MWQEEELFDSAVSDFEGLFEKIYFKKCIYMCREMNDGASA